MKHIFTYSATLLLGLGLLAAPKAEAQQFSKRKKYNTVSFSLNAMNYFGDVTPETNFTSFRFGATRPNVGVAISRRFTPRITGRLGLSYGRITGDDSKAANENSPDGQYRYNRNMSFRNDILELAGTVVVDLIENRNNYLKRPDFVPYVFAGVAGFYHNPQGLYSDGTYVNLADLKTEGISYGQTQISIPFGGGIRYRINRNFDASLEIGWRKTFTDYLDDVSTNYLGAENLTGGAAQQYFGGGNVRDPDKFPGFSSAGARRGDSSDDDWYIVTGLSLNYILTPRIKNPKFR